MQVTSFLPAIQCEAMYDAVGTGTHQGGKNDCQPVQASEQ